jgi:hypothetical protein
MATSVPPVPAPASESPPLIAHQYRQVFSDAGSLVFWKGQPWVFSSQGAGDLATGRVLFQGQFGNWTVYQGDSLWFADGFSPMSACPRRSTLVQLVGEKWVPRRELNVHDLEVSAWLPGSSLAAITPRRAGPPWGYELVVLELNRRAPVPERAGKTRAEGCHTRLSTAQTLAAFTTGEIFVFGIECPLLPKETVNEHGETVTEDAEWKPAVAVESWKAGATKSRFDVLPLRELSRIFPVGPRDIWVFGSVTETVWGFAHFDGTAWQLAPQRFDHQLEAPLPPRASSGAEGLILRAGRLLESVQGEAREHQLPAGCAAVSMQLHDEQLWITCDDGAIYTTDSRIQPFQFPLEHAEQGRVLWSEMSLPKLDNKAPHSGCGGPRHDTGPRSSGRAGHKRGH